MISGEIESYEGLVIVERIEVTQGKGCWPFLVRVESRNALFTSVMVKDKLSWVSLAADLEPLSG